MPVTNKCYDHFVLPQFIRFIFANGIYFDNPQFDQEVKNLFTRHKFLETLNFQQKELNQYNEDGAIATVKDVYSCMQEIEDSIKTGDIKDVKKFLFTSIEDDSLIKKLKNIVWTANIYMTQLADYALMMNIDKFLSELEVFGKFLLETDKSYPHLMQNFKLKTVVQFDAVIWEMIDCSFSILNNMENKFLDPKYVGIELFYTCYRKAADEKYGKSRVDPASENYGKLKIVLSKKIHGCCDQKMQDNNNNNNAVSQPKKNLATFSKGLGGVTSLLSGLIVNPRKRTSHDNKGEASILKIYLSQIPSVLSVMTLGPKKSGKSSLVDRFFNNKYSEEGYFNSLHTVNKQINIEDSTLQLKLLDPDVGDPNSMAIMRYAAKMHGIILVIDLASKDAKDQMNYYLRNLTRCSDPSKQFVLIVGNKSDLLPLEDRSDFLQAAKATYPYDVGYIETSAKNNINVAAAFANLIENSLRVLSQSTKASAYTATM